MLRLKKWNGPIALSWVLALQYCLNTRLLYKKKCFSWINQYFSCVEWKMGVRSDLSTIVVLPPLWLRSLAIKYCWNNLNSFGSILVGRCCRTTTSLIGANWSFIRTGYEKWTNRGFWQEKGIRSNDALWVVCPSYVSFLNMYI